MSLSNLCETNHVKLMNEKWSSYHDIYISQTGKRWFSWLKIVINKISLKEVTCMNDAIKFYFRVRWKILSFWEIINYFDVINLFFRVTCIKIKVIVSDFRC